MSSTPLPAAEAPGQLRRRIGVPDAVMIGLGSMIGAGIFASLAPAASVAGSGLLLGLALAAVVAYCNATSSARLAALYPASGGTYVYARERLSAFWGYLAGWAFVVGKTASCAAMALTVGSYVWPGQAHAVAVAAVVALTAVNYAGIQKSVLLTRIATLGEEVRDPARTIPRAIPIALGITLVVYALVSVSVLLVLGPGGLASAGAPLTEAARAAGADWLAPVVRVGAAVAALGSLLALILGVSRTTLAMARDHHLPHALAAVHPRFKVPHRAELLVGAVVAVVAATTDVRGTIGFSSFGVLAYYAIANASAWTLTSAEGRPARIIPVAGLVGCLVLAFALPLPSVLTGAAVLLIGAAAYGICRVGTRH
ncbi:APC family permease [Streptomyces microflavus]